MPAHRLPAHDIDGIPVADVSGRRAVAQLRAGERGAAPIYHAPCSTGLPGGLKAGIEAASGLSMDGVRVHYGSPEPARLNAHAFARGADIHLAPGQERHLAHEAWHVVQQAKGRVRPTTAVGGIAVNDDPVLEHEADVQGEASARRAASPIPVDAPRSADPIAAPMQLRSTDGCVQRVIKISSGDHKGLYVTKGGAFTKQMISDIEGEIGDELARGWKSWVAELAGDKKKTYKYTSDEFLDELRTQFPKKSSSGSKIRPNFFKSAYWLGAITREIQTGEDQSDLKPSEENLALPHRHPYKAIETSTDLFLTGKEDADDLYRWSDRLIDATKKRRDINLKQIKNKKKRKRYEDTVEDQLDGMNKARKKLKREVESGKKLDLSSGTVQEFLKYTNSLHGNVPDYGPHAGVNIQVSDRTHLNVEEDGTLTPGSFAAGSMSPHRGRGVARTSDGQYIVTTGGHKFDPTELSKKLQKLLDTRGYSDTTIDEDDLEEYES
ncbi:eCIS core domain-containing protein [Sphingomonas sp. DT-204]|uniref:eCIS core domain-containing protein n=1 Tax=Sphingomonas sp. DT-204 TaxID=3396166 RepID=UPI003F1CC53B